MGDILTGESDDGVAASECGVVHGRMHEATSHVHCHGIYDLGIPLRRMYILSNHRFFILLICV